MGWIFFIKNKSYACQVMIGFINYIQRQFNALVLAVMTDNGGEYVQIDVYFKQQGIRYIRIPPYSHQSNGVPERYNRTIQTMARGMGGSMFYSSISEEPPPTCTPSRDNTL